ncbi:hypothetical protein [Yinghuangia sp. YIM S10712]|uniref:hypothetical protein n=1 Tax=Yinghuangia sp. YIM S10712 TaxID=3436930 RepID=UPI003F530198
MIALDLADRGHRRMTLAVYRIAPDGSRTDIVPRRTVAGSWLDVPAPSPMLPPCGCPRCVGVGR